MRELRTATSQHLCPAARDFRRAKIKIVKDRSAFAGRQCPALLLTKRLIVPTSLCLCGVLWVLLLPHSWFLFAFGFMGAGDLYAVYFPNYIMSRSSPNKVRHNIAFLQLTSLPVCMAPAALGAISDVFGHRASFVAAAILLAVSLALIIMSLPLDPTPTDEPG
jgi:hypothetical protein